MLRWNVAIVLPGLDAHAQVKLTFKENYKSWKNMCITATIPCPKNCHNKSHNIVKQSFKFILGLLFGLFMYSHQNLNLPLKFDCKFTLQAYRKKFIRIIQETLIYIVCLFVELTSNNFPLFFYQGPKFYNSLSTEIVSSSSFVSFKKALKAFFRSNY